MTPIDSLVTGLDPDSDGFWREVGRKHLPVRRCTACDTRFVLPLPACPECGCPDLEIIESSGAGSLYSWVVVNYAFDEQLSRQVPYVVGAIDLDERARLFARVEGVEPEAIVPGLRLTATFPDDAGRPPIVFVPEKGGCR
ncbi:MAG: hypothetical protein JWP76_396 [Dactylosporangium sp.]|jgi:uncharacterized OB-fold protein|nr:hypothetical protein [Dactylosporangium sp.]